jgi:hypothetical protein
MVRHCQSCPTTARLPPESIKLGASTIGIANGLLAGAFTHAEARNSREYAIQQSIPSE